MASPRTRSEQATAHILEAARDDWRVWASLGSLLPLLAEAHPDQFLSAVDAGLIGPEPTLLPLFEGDGGGLTSAPAHIGLLWALENVAWSPQLLPRASLVLSRLAALDPGGKSSNRPINSLGDIFRPWLPQTSADLDQRLVALDRLSEHHPDTAWTVMVHMLPTLHVIGQYTHRPRWRDWAREPDRRPSMSEYTSAVSAVLTRLLLLVDDRGERWRDLIGATSGLPPDLRALVVQRLSELANVAPGTRATIWSALRELVARHRSHPDAQWAMPAQEVEGLATLLDRFEPEDLNDRFGWLFTDVPRLIEDVGGWRERQDTLRETRVAAATRVGSVRFQGSIRRRTERSPPRLSVTTRPTSPRSASASADINYQCYYECDAGFTLDRSATEARPEQCAVGTPSSWERMPPRVFRPHSTVPMRSASMCRRC